VGRINGGLVENTITPATVASDATGLVVGIIFLTSYKIQAGRVGTTPIPTDLIFIRCLINHPIVEGTFVVTQIHVH
jgi:hypothetical protein